MRLHRLLLLITLVIAGICADNSLPYPESNFTPFQNSSIRVKRAQNADAFSLLESRISSLSRVITGVSLYNGLIDGSIPVDEAIAELMNIGTISLKDLETFEKKKVDAFVEKLKEAGQKFNTNSETLQKYLIDVQAIGVMWNSVGDLATLPEGSELDGISPLKTMDLKAVDSVAFEDIIKALNDRTDIAQAKKSLETLSSVLTSTMAAFEKGQILSTLNKMAPFDRFVQLVQYYEAAHISTMAFTQKEEVDSFVSNSKVLIDLKSGKSSILGSLGLGTKKTFTSGFVNGVSDMKTLLDEIKEPWINSTTHHVDLKDAFIALSTLSDDLAPLNDQLNPVRVAKRVSRQLQYFQSKLSALQDAPKSPQPIVDAVKKCPLTAVSAQFQQDLNKINSNSERLLRKVQLIQSTSNVLSENAGSISSLDASKPETVELVLRLLETMKFDFEELTSGQKIGNLANELLSGKGTINDFVKNGDFVKYSKIFHCLQDLKNDLEVISSASSLMFEIKETVKDDFVKEVSQISTQISGASSHVKAARKSMESFKVSKRVKNLETLQSLKKLEKFVTPLGDSSTALMMIRNVLENSSDVLTFLGQGGTIEEGVNSLSTDPIMQKKIRNKWNGFEVAKRELVELLKDIQSRKSKLPSLENAKLEDHEPVLATFAGLGDVHLDVDVLDSALALLTEKLSDPSLKTKVENARRNLMVLESLDLEFAKFDTSLSGMSGTMSGIKKVFMEAMAATPAPVTVAATKPARPIPGASVGANQEATSMEPEAGFGVGAIAGSIALGILLIGGFVLLVLAWCKKWCCFKKKPIPAPKPKKPSNNEAAKTKTTSNTSQSKSNETPSAATSSGTAAPASAARPASVQLQLPPQAPPSRAPVAEAPPPVAPVAQAPAAPAGQAIPAQAPPPPPNLPPNQENLPAEEQVPPPKKVPPREEYMESQSDDITMIGVPSIKD